VRIVARFTRPGRDGRQGQISLRALRAVPRPLVRERIGPVPFAFFAGGQVYLERLGYLHFAQNGHAGPSCTQRCCCHLDGPGHGYLRLRHPPKG